MKKKNIVLAVAAAAIGAYAISKNDAAKLKLTNSLYRGHSMIMDAGVKAFPGMFPTPETVLGCGSRKEIPGLLKKYGISKVLIVTGPTVGRTIVPPIKEDIERSGIPCEVFDKTEVNPSVTTVLAIKKKYLETGCSGFLAIGGGSPMDAAKIAAATVARPNMPIVKMAGMMRILAPVPPVICVPTTAGTGSEVTIGAVISDYDAHHKYAITDPCITPKAAVIDAELTVGMPPFITATTGVDALTHAVESYLTCMYNNDFTNRNCEEAVVAIFKYLDRAYNDPNDVEALGGLYNTAHGLANSVILPIVLEDYGECVYPKLARLAEITGIKTDGSEAERARAFIAAIRAMNKRLGLPTGFDFIKPEDYETIAKWALAETNVNYPVPVRYDRTRLWHVLNRIVLEA